MRSDSLQCGFSSHTSEVFCPLAFCKALPAKFTQGQTAEAAKLPCKKSGCLAVAVVSVSSCQASLDNGYPDAVSRASSVKISITYSKRQNHCKQCLLCYSSAQEAAKNSSTSTSCGLQANFSFHHCLDEGSSSGTSLPTMNGWSKVFLGFSTT